MCGGTLICFSWIIMLEQQCGLPIISWVEIQRLPKLQEMANYQHTKRYFFSLKSYFQPVWEISVNFKRFEANQGLL